MAPIINLTNGLPPIDLSYTGSWEYHKTGMRTGYAIFYGSGTLTISTKMNDADIWGVGGGGGAGSEVNTNYLVGGGGGGGYSDQKTGQAINAGTYAITIGGGGNAGPIDLVTPGGTGGASTFVGYISAGGGYGGGPCGGSVAGYGGAGGSGGGGSGHTYGAGGTNGGNGAPGVTFTGAGGAGSGISGYAFRDAGNGISAALYGSGGDGAGDIYGTRSPKRGQAGGVNTGGGGNGPEYTTSAYGGAGGSGITIIRWRN